MNKLRVPKIGESIMHLLLGLVLLAILIIILPFKLARWFMFLWRSRVCFLDIVYCPDGHPNTVYEMWECQRCGSRFKGWAWQRCPICGYTCCYMSCAVCGLAIKNPLL